MKNRYYIIAAAVIVLAASCQREGFEPVKMQELTFTASWEDDPVTRTVLDKDGSSVLWCPDEYFKVFSGTMSGQFYSMNAYTTDIIEIRGGLVPNNGNSGSTSGTYFAFYPYSANAVCDDSWNGKAEITFTLSHEQNSVTGSFANNFAPAVAISNDFHFTFYNVCGGICFTLTEPGVNKITFSSHGNEPLTGTLTIGFDSDGKPVINSIADGNNYVTVQAPEGGFIPGEKYYAMVIPGQISGITAYMSKGGRSILYKLEKDITVKRSVFGHIKDIDKNMWDMPSADSYEVVDLGLSVLWCTVNLGARCPEEFGSYYAWGETDTKEEYLWNNYKWGLSDSLTKYCMNSNYGTVDNLSSLLSEDDAASVAIGSDWRIPSSREWNELLRNCYWTYTTMSGVPGCLITSWIEGYTDKSIFLPFAGQWTRAKYAPGFSYDNNVMYYWCNDLSYNYQSHYLSVSYYYDEYAKEEHWDSFGTDYGMDRSTGLPIRPVKTK